MLDRRLPTLRFRVSCCCTKMGADWVTFGNRRARSERLTICSPVFASEPQIQQSMLILKPNNRVLISTGMAKRGSISEWQEFSRRKAKRQSRHSWPNLTGDGSRPRIGPLGRSAATTVNPSKHHSFSSLAGRTNGSLCQPQCACGTSFLQMRQI